MGRRSVPTLDDVARQAGVSTATVSRVLNSPERVSESTRELVLRTVDQLGYTPHFGGRALASNRFNTMAAVVPTMENSIFARGLQAFQETLAIADVTLLVASSGYDPKQEFEQIRTLASRGTDGLLLIGIARPTRTYEFLNQRHFPYVVTWNYSGDQKFSLVGFDNRKAARAMTRAVIEHGHREIAMIAGKTSSNDRASDRVDGVRDALEEAGLARDRLPVVESAYSLAGGRAAMARLLQRTPRPTAVICGNDVLAFGAISMAKARGLRVPQDLSVTGFDDIELADVFEPALTTVHVPQRSMGEAAAKILLDMREGAVDRRQIELETRIIMRNSLAPAPGSSPPL